MSLFVDKLWISGGFLLIWAIFGLFVFSFGFCIVKRNLTFGNYESLVGRLTVCYFIEILVFLIEMIDHFYKLLTTIKILYFSCLLFLLDTFHEFLSGYYF